MPRDTKGSWYPDLFGKQLVVFNSRARALLVSGPRLSGKTRSTLHRLVRHLWETPNARVAMFSRTIKNSKEGGTWSLLHTVILPEWIKAKIGCRYTTKTAEKRPGPRIDGVSRTPYFRIRNVHGGESECFLFSLDYDPDIEDKLKEMEFSLIYFSELSKFHDRKVLSVALLSLRMSHIRYEDHMWLADTNPADEGDLSWIYRVWYFERTTDYANYSAMQKKMGLPALDEPLFNSLQKDLALVEIKPEENIRLDKRQLDELKATCAYDPDLYAKYVEGKWIYGEGRASLHFATHFKPHKHVIGAVDSLDETEWTYANPSPSSFELILGFDLGDTNHAAVILDRQIIRGLSYFTVVDELVSIKTEVSLDDITKEFMAKIVALETLAGRQYNLDRSWSDHSSIDKYSAVGNTFPHLQVHAASGGRIFLRALPNAQSKGTVRTRIQLIKQLLFNGRLHISAHCDAIIQMLKTLKKGRVDIIDTVDMQKHIFDALSYALFMECQEELELGTQEAANAAQRSGIARNIG
jgi:Terminase large subunit, T4likevirus-type, N-terminal